MTTLRCYWLNLKPNKAKEIKKLITCTSCKQYMLYSMMSGVATTDISNWLASGEESAEASCPYYEQIEEMIDSLP